MIRALSIINNFNPHSHEGSDEKVGNAGEWLKISIHTPTKGVTQCFHLLFLSAVNFNPHSHEGSDDYEKQLDEILTISIHTPTKGVTLSVSCFVNAAPTISIHTPTKGVTAILTNNFLIFCSISLINFILYLKIIQILFIFRYKFIFYFIF